MTAEVKEEPDEQEIAKPGAQKEEEKKGEPQEVSQVDQQIMKRIKASKKLVIETKKLFATMLLSDKKYTDPSKVLQAIVDDYGNPISIGEQKDIGEFNSTFLARIQEGLNAEQIIAKLKEHELQKSLSSSQQPNSHSSADIEMHQANTSAIDSKEAQDVHMIDTNSEQLQLGKRT